MPLRKIRKQNQANDLLGQISQSWKKGHSLSGAITHATVRYPELSVGAISRIASSAYASKASLASIFSGSLTQFQNLRDTFKCPSGQIKFAAQLRYVNETTGEQKRFGTDIVVVLKPGASSLASMIKGIVGTITAAIKGWSYKIKEPAKDATIAEYIYGPTGNVFVDSALELHSFECLPEK